MAKELRRSVVLHRAQHAVPLRRDWSAALRRAQQAAPLQRKSSAGFWVGGVQLETGPRGDHDNGGFTEQCCRGDCSPFCSAPTLNLVFIVTMIGISEAEGKDLNVVSISNCSHSAYARCRYCRRTEKSRRDAGATKDKGAMRKASPLKTLRSSGRA